MDTPQAYVSRARREGAPIYRLYHHWQRDVKTPVISSFFLCFQHFTPRKSFFNDQPQVNEPDSILFVIDLLLGPRIQARLAANGAFRITWKGPQNSPGSLRAQRNSGTKPTR